jgi:hypothetical protein
MACYLVKHKEALPLPCIFVTTTTTSPLRSRWNIGRQAIYAVNYFLFR